jgi:hypothetical protein
MNKGEISKVSDNILNFLIKEHSLMQLRSTNFISQTLGNGLNQHVKIINT